MEHQVVAGTNYRIRAHLQPSGLMSLSVFEQPWTQTLEVTEATLTPSDDSSAITDPRGCISRAAPVRLDAAERYSPSGSRWRSRRKDRHNRRAWHGVSENSIKIHLQNVLYRS